jgi:hypothetical protein
MPASGPLHPIRDDGTSVDATFELSSVPVFEIVFHYKAGARGRDRSVNADYHEGLELLLARLASVGASILGIAVDSAMARELDLAERELDLPFPLRVDSTTDAGALRLEITRAQKPVARREGAKAGGGNDQKTVRMTIAFDDAGLDFPRVSQLLVAPAVAADGSARGEPPRASRSHGGPLSPRIASRRRAFPKVKDLIMAGMLRPGTVVHATCQGRNWRAVVLADGRARLEGEQEPELFGKLTNRVAGHSESAMRLWSVERDGQLTPLAVLRDELAMSAAWGETG